MPDRLKSPPSTPAVDASAAGIWREAARDRTILLVEDNEDHRYVYTRVLRLAGYRVAEATDGERGVEEARRLRPDLVVVDVGLPRMDGWEVIERLNDDPATRGTPVIVVTVHAFDHDVARAAALGCALHLAKPHSPVDLVMAVHQTLGLA
jgi:CheY-like chemotaxis protein